mmetsp:Transcript_91414/g.258429  ORF Transcript_91414/g.258429 Transcript_91414/m.258429 type:complete len:208 (+) Transcript_91414:3-626(+)
MTGRSLATDGIEMRSIAEWAGWRARPAVCPAKLCALGGVPPRRVSTLVQLAREAVAREEDGRVGLGASEFRDTPLQRNISGIALVECRAAVLHKHQTRVADAEEGARGLQDVEAVRLLADLAPVDDPAQGQLRVVCHGHAGDDVVKPGAETVYALLDVQARSVRAVQPARRAAAQERVDPDRIDPAEAHRLRHPAAPWVQGRRVPIA